MSQKYSTKLLAEVAIKPPVEGGADGAIKFTIDSLKMDKNKTWTLKIKVGSIPGTMRSEYNLILAPNPKGYQSSIREILVQYDDNQLTLDEMTEEGSQRVDPVYRINQVLDSYNEQIDVMGVVNVHGRIDGFKRGGKQKEITVVIGAGMVDFFAEEFDPFRDWVVYFEPAFTDESKVEFSVRTRQEFKAKRLNPQDFLEA